MGHITTSDLAVRAAIDDGLKTRPFYLCNAGARGQRSTFRGCGLLGGLCGQVALLVEDEEGGDAQAFGAQQLHAALRRRGVVHHDKVQRAGRRGHGNVVLGVDGAQVTCTDMPRKILHQCLPVVSLATARCCSAFQLQQFF